MKKNIRYMLAAHIVVVMLCGLNGCSSNSGDTEQIVTEAEDKSILNEMGDKQIAKQDSSGGTDETAQNEKNNNTENVINEEQNDAEKATSGENLDVVEPDPADDDWYMKGGIYTDDQGNLLEVFFNDHGTLEFAVNGLSVYFTTVDNFEYENDWRVYTCDDGTMIVYYPGEPAHIEIGDGDYAGLYEKTVTFQATILEIHDNNYLVEPVEGSAELNSADQITVPITGMNVSPEPEVGDTLEILYDGEIAESYPAQITNVYSISVVE